MHPDDAPRPRGPGPGRVGLLLLWIAVAFAYFAPGRIEPERVSDDAGLPRRLERVSDARSVVALLSSPRGDVWVVTRERVTRYAGGEPGRREVVLDAARYRERFGRHLDPLTAAHVDALGALWVGSRRGEILVFEEGAWLERSSRVAEPTDTVRALATREGELFAAGRGLWRGPRHAGAFTPDGHFARARIDHLVAGDTLGVALATGGQVWRRDAAAAEWTHAWRGGSEDGAIGALAVTPDDELWIGTRSGLVRIARDGGLRRELTGQPVDTLALGPAAALAGTRGAGLYARFAGDWRRVDAGGDVAWSHVSALATAPGGAFWLAVRDRGVYRAGPAHRDAAAPRD